MKYISMICTSVLLTLQVQAQTKALTNTSHSKHAVLTSVNMGDVQWTQGFWADRFRVCRDSMVPYLYKTYTDANVSHAFENFRIAAGIDTGSHSGPPFHDGDFYKLLEGIANLYATTRDPKLDVLMDTAIAVIIRAQRPDGYIHTPVLIAARKQGGEKAFGDRLNFETYNLGHLMTAGCVHYRATGKRTLLDAAIKATDYLNRFYTHASPELARNAICPSHYMGVIEMYRTTGNPAYLALAKNLINIRGLVDSIGTDDNQDRIPFRQQDKAMGHAVRANYLYAGVADVYAETGEDSLWLRLNQIWHDVTEHKMYITGACGALYDGVSPYGVSYEPRYIQKTHQAYGRDYQLPNMTAHNETCANIGNVLWNWRMLQVSGDARYADVMEQTLYNSVLSGISLDGRRFFYTNPLSASQDFPYTLRWSGGRVEYIRLSNCCPPNVVRTISEVNNYTYSLSNKGLYVNLYGGSRLHTTVNGTVLQVEQQTNYPWSGDVRLVITQVPSADYTFFLRIPGWCNKATIRINGQPYTTATSAGTYATVRKVWKAGDVITLQMDMPARLIEANPLVEETRNQVAVMRGPIVYCAESPDMQAGRVSDLVIPATTQFTPVKDTVANTSLTALTGKVKMTNKKWKGKLYQPFSTTGRLVTVKLIPYYAWANRGKSDMSVWLPVE